MSLRVYNTLSHNKSEFEPLVPNTVSMYVCGPTVYDSAHVGHAMSSLVFDIIRRYLEFSGYQVRHVMNYTDVDDKIIQRAMYEEIDPLELTERYIGEYEQHLKELNILPAHVNPKVTDEIENIIAMVSGLIENGSAYESEGDVYFRVGKDEDYGKLSGRKLEDMQAGEKADTEDRKENPKDFAVWKSAKEFEPSWDSPWGAGRPGWHIECSAMSLNHLGEQIDIHGGGNDLVFPHHENEIAQTESFTGKSFANYWLHNGMMQLSGEKMSKSLGNLVTIEEFLKENEADVLRLMILNTNYRGPLTFNDEVIDQSTKALERLRNGLRPAFPEASGLDEQVKGKLGDQIEQAKENFITAMDDDFNTAGALGHLFDLVRMINQCRDSGATPIELTPAQDLLSELSGVLGLKMNKTSTDLAQAAPFIDLLVELRKKLRDEKNWELSDLLRDRLIELSVVLEDSKEGTTWRWE